MIARSCSPFEEEEEQDTLRYISREGVWVIILSRRIVVDLLLHRGGGLDKWHVFLSLSFPRKRTIFLPSLPSSLLLLPRWNNRIHNAAHFIYHNSRIALGCFLNPSNNNTLEFCPGPRHQPPVLLPLLLLMMLLNRLECVPDWLFGHRLERLPSSSSSYSPFLEDRTGTCGGQCV